MEHKINITDATHLSKLMTAGKSTLTFVSMRTGNRLTYEFKALDERKLEDGKDQPIFVSILSGSNNESDWHYFFG